jgi:mevalonate kinase
MINLSEVTNSQPLVILRGEYGIVAGNDSLIAAPNPKKGVILILSDNINKVVSMAHFDCEENIEANIDNIIQEMTQQGAEISNLQSHIIENDKL